MKKEQVKILSLALLASLAVVFTARGAGEAKSRGPELSLDAGSLGFGGTLSWRFSDHFGGRAGVNYLKLTEDGDTIEGIAYNSEMRLMSEPIAVDFYPWADKAWRVTLGVLLNQNEVTGEVPNPGAPGTIVQIGGNGYDVFNDLGSLSLTVDQLAVSPYLSVGGEFYLDDAERWSVGGEIGVAYTGSPDASISIGNAATAGNATFQADRAAEESQVEDELDKFQLYPIVKVYVGFTF
jgi:hypothetical protein